MVVPWGDCKAGPVSLIGGGLDIYPHGEETLGSPGVPVNAAAS